MNNFFPALEGGVVDEYAHQQKDQLYPKFGIDSMQQPTNIIVHGGGNNNPNMVVQDQIDEVPPEQEEAESQENIGFHHPNNMYQLAEKQLR